MPPKSNVPIRICGSKTRSGCKTCKARHLKCDEGQPICARCQKAGRQCVYAALQTADTIEAHSRANSNSPSPGTNLSFYGSSSAAEISAVKSFVAYPGRELGGPFSDRVWRQIIPQVAQYEPSIWNAVVAVSMLDEHIRQHGEPACDFDSANRQYGKAMKELSLRLAAGVNTCSRDVVLLSCILLAIFESLRAHNQSALRHISSGMKLLMEWEQETQLDQQNVVKGYLNRSHLLPIFLQLDSQAVQMGPTDFRDYVSLPAIDGLLQTPELFVSADEAYVSLVYIFNRMSHWSGWLEPNQSAGAVPDADWLADETRKLQTQLTEWDIAFEPYQIIAADEPATILLKLERTIIEIYFAKSLDGPREIEYDKSMHLFQRATEYAEEYMEMTMGLDQSHKISERPAFALTMDLVLPLFLIGARCRNPSIRRRALKLLRLCNRKEGIWDSRPCAELVQKTIDLEEAGALADGSIPDSARIYMFQVSLEGESASEVTQKKFVYNEDGGQFIEA